MFRRASSTRLGVFKVVKIQFEVFWIATPRSVVVGYQRFRGPYRLQPDLHISYFCPSSFTSPWRRRQQRPPKHWYPT